MSDGVKPALEVGISAARNELAVPYPRATWSATATVAAISAFLLARAKDLRREPGMQVYADFLEAEAAAVERAAKEPTP